MPFCVGNSSALGWKGRLFRLDSGVLNIPRMASQRSRAKWSICGERRDAEAEMERTMGRKRREGLLYGVAGPGKRIPLEGTENGTVLIGDGFMSRKERSSKDPLRWLVHPPPRSFWDPVSFIWPICAKKE